MINLKRKSGSSGKRASKSSCDRTISDKSASALEAKLTQAMEEIKEESERTPYRTMKSVYGASNNQPG